MESRDKDSGWNLEWGLLVIAALGACALAVAYRDGWSPSGPDTNAAAKLGQMGDFFGGMLNPLVSALTLFVAISVWQLQKKELKATKIALDEQAKTAEQQRQEQRFFDLLNVYQRTVDSIQHSIKPTSSSQSGKFAIQQWLSNTSLLRECGLRPELHIRAELRNLWIDSNAIGMFDHYFRVVFRIASEAEALLTDQHYRYIKLFRAQFSGYELILLGFNLWLNDEGKKMLPLAEKYGLLKHLPTGHLRTELEKLHPKVFGRQRAQSLQALSPIHQPEASL